MTIEVEKVLSFFKEISSIPRSSGNEEQIATYLENFAHDRNLECYRDSYNNVLIKKKGTKNHNKTLIMHAHTDMVCVKTDDSNHNFDKEPIEIVIDGDSIKAKDTTLGADDGIGMSFILYILDANDLDHPNLECLFTAEEETTYNGATNFDYRKLNGESLLSLDNCQDDTIVIGCAGSIATEYTFIGHQEKTTLPSYKISISNLSGGNAGIEVDNNRTNAIALMANILDHLRQFDDIYINMINGGTSETDIANNSECIFNTKINNPEEKIKAYIKKYSCIDESPKLEISSIHNDIVLSSADSNNIIDEIISLSHRIITKDNSQVITSQNIGIIKTINNQVIIKHQLQSKDEQELVEYNKKIDSTSKQYHFKADIIYTDDIWKPNEKSQLKELYEQAFYNVNKKYPTIKCIQAGVECGVFSREKNDLDIILVGTIIENFHTTNEKIYISSCEKTLKTLIEFIKLY